MSHPGLPYTRLLAPAAALLLLASAPALRAAERERDSATAGAAAALPRTPRPDDAKLYIISPTDGETVASSVTVRFALRGMGVAPAGVDAPDTGHHHLVVGADLPPLGLPLPSDAQHIHFGGGQTETTLDLAPDTHELQRVLGDKNHIPHDPPPLSDRIPITVSPTP